MLTDDLKKYVADSVARKGQGGAVTGLCGTINQIVRDAFRGSPIRYNSPSNLREYIVNQVLDAKKAEPESERSGRKTSATGTGYVLSVEPPLVRLEDGRRMPYVSRLPVAPGKYYTYYTAGSTVVLEGVFEGAMTRPRDYPVDAESLDGFMMHPRTGPVTTKMFLKNEGGSEVYEAHGIVNSPGYDSEHEPLASAVSAFPMVDDDQGSKNLQFVKEWLIDEETNENYGNLDWISPDDEPRILTFKGPPGRHVPLNPTLDIPGCTVYDETVEGTYGDTTYYTPFTPNVYEEGEVLAVAPAKVLGVGLRDGLLVALCGENRRPNGFWNVLYATRSMNTKGEVKDGAWYKVYEWCGSRPRLPWFFNQSCTQAVNGNQLLTFDPVEKTATLEGLNDGDGAFSVSEEFWRVSANGSYTTAREFDGDQLVTLGASLVGQESSDFPSDIITSNDDLRVYFEGKFARAVVILGTETPTVGTAYSYQLTDGDVVCHPAKWSMSGGTIDPNTGTITAITGCGMGSVTVTFQDGPTATKPVRLPTGTWILISESHSAPNTCGYIPLYDMLACWGIFIKITDNILIAQYGNTTNLDTVCSDTRCLPSEIGVMYEYESCASDGGGRIHTSNPLKMCYVFAIYRYRWGCP